MHLSTWKFRPRWGGSVIIPMLDGAPRAPRLSVWDSVIVALGKKSDLTFRDQHFDYIFECHFFIFSHKERPRARYWWKIEKKKMKEGKNSLRSKDGLIRETSGNYSKQNPAMKRNALRKGRHTNLIKIVRPSQSFDVTQKGKWEG